MFDDFCWGSDGVSDCDTHTHTRTSCASYGLLAQYGSVWLSGFQQGGGLISLRCIPWFLIAIQSLTSDGLSQAWDKTSPSGWCNSSITYCILYIYIYLLICLCYVFQSVWSGGHDLFNLAFEGVLEARIHVARHGLWRNQKPGGFNM